jgi:predicted HAD superfamily Cof-like phosphohydrolase
VNPYQAAVLEFHHKMQQAAPERPTLDDYPFELRAKLILEEALEFMEACGLKQRAGFPVGVFLPALTGPDWSSMIDALCDILYVTFGAAVAMGIDLDRFFEEVQRANLAKAGGPVREDGKRLKPPGWTPPDIKAILTAVLEGR